MLSSFTRNFNKFDLLIALLVIILAAGAAWGVAQYGGGLFFTILGVFLAAVTMVVVIIKQPAWGASLILALAPFEGYLEIGGQSAVRLVTLLCVGVLAFRILLTRRPFVFDRTASWMLALVSWALISILWSPDLEGSLPDWISFALQGFLYIIILNLIFSLNELKLALWGHVLGGLIFSIVFINLMVSRDFLRNEDILGLGINLTSRLIGLNLLISMLLFQMQKNGFARVVLVISIITSAIGVVIAFSRGTWMGVLASLGVVFVVYVVRKELRISVRDVFLWSLVTLVGFYILNIYILDTHGTAKMIDRFQSGVTLSDDAGGRFEIWKVAWKIFLDSPIFGHGFDTFPDQFLRFAEQTGLSNFFHVNEAKQPHNAYVKIISELGIPGMILFAGVLASVAARVRKLLIDKQVNVSALAWTLALLVYLLVATFVDSAVIRKYFWYTLSLIVLLVQYWGIKLPAETETTSEEAA